MSENVIVYMTTPTRFEAEKISKALVEKKLAACVNIIGDSYSVFRWQGETKNENETIMIAKTKASLMTELINTVKNIHSYECPCIIALPVIAGSEDFLGWINSELS